jgi:orotate phosphoribosyltransferase
MDPRSRLIELVLEKSYREGDFTLASGAKSRFYIDLKATTLSAPGARAAGEAVCELLVREGIMGAGAQSVQAAGGLTLGADPIATAVSIASLAHVDGGIRAFIVRKEVKSHGTSRWIEGLEGLSPGAPVVVLEDVSTTGASAWQAVERVSEAGFRVAAVVSLVDREQGAREFFGGQGVRFLPLISISEIRSRYRT